MGVESAGVWQCPNAGAFPVGLWADFGFGLGKGDAVGGDAQEGEAFGFVLIDFGGEQFAACFDFGGGEFVGAGGGTGGHVGDAVAEFW